ncbi:MAG TPA: hypothetical protein VF950_24250 [Planctomycetota bacterium]
MTWLLLGLSLIPQDRLPVPEAGAQRDAEKFFKDLFKDEYKGRSDPEKRILAQKLYTQALELKDHPARKFVALRQAYDVALQGNALDRAETALAALREQFAAPVAALKLAILAVRAKTTTEYKAHANDHLDVAVEAADEEDFDTAAKAVKSASDFARKAKEAALVGKADAVAKEVADRKAKFDVIRRAKDVLKANPADPAANLTVGRHEALAKGLWEVGLPYLEKSADETLKKLAQWDLAGPTRPEDQLAVADGWWDAGEKEAEPAKAALRRRAGAWYAKCAATAPASAKARVTERLKAAGTAVKTSLGPFKLDDEGAIRHWLLLGPFEKPYNAAIKEDFLGGEAKAKPGAGLEQGAFTWTPHAAESGKVVLSPVIWPPKDHTTVYAACWVEAEADVKAVLRIGSDDGYKLWIDGEHVGGDWAPRGFKWDQNSHDVTFSKGRHLLLMKICNWERGFEFAVRVTTKNFEVPQGLTIRN